VVCEQEETDMPEVYLQVKLVVRRAGGGAAELVLPPQLEGVNFRFLLVKDGAEEGIVSVVDEAPSLVERLQKAVEITKLSLEQLESIRASYPAPRLKQKYRVQAVSEGETPTALVETDDEGNRIVETVQTVRCGYYLIDVPVKPS